METSLSRFLVGLSVKICRSDGRVHLATVKSMDMVKFAVNVEWTERKIRRRKQVDLSELCILNPELLDNFKTVPTPFQTQPLLLQTRGMRVHCAHPEFLPLPPVFANWSPTRQTFLLQAPAPVAASVPTSESSQANLETVHPNPPSSSLLANSALHNPHHRKNEPKPAQSLTFVREAIKENEPEMMPPPPAVKGKTKSVASEELNKGSERLSCVVNPPDMQNKREKFGEAHRPNQKFYEMIQDFRETLEITPLSTNEHIEPRRICVCVHKRPLNKQENEMDVVSVPGKGTLLVHEPKRKVDLTKYLENQIFHFDYSFNETATNDLVYKFTAKPLVYSIFEGGMATCFAYGQTGSGKTHTMGGDFTGRQQNGAKGIYALAAQDVFTYLNHQTYANLDLSAYVSFFEIYNGKVYDLLNNKAKLRVLEDDRQQVQVVGLEEVCVSSAEQVIEIIQQGSVCRTSGQTNANSSRSHAILQIVLRHNNRATTLHGKLSLIDLATSERGNDRSTSAETAKINRSLLALKECICSLGMNSDHIPFRLSTLTRVLRDSFVGGKSKTCMIAMVSPGMTSWEYMMNTLRYADGVKELTGKSKVNREATAQEPIHGSTEESGVDASVYAISQAAELEEVYVQLQTAKELLNALSETYCNIEEVLPDLVDHANKLMDTVQALQTAVEQESKAKLLKRTQLTKCV